jgi:predicted PurR-regulated permease PerM
VARQSPNDSAPGTAPVAVSKMLVVFSSGLTVVVLYLARDIIVPITLALLLSFLMSPIVRALRRLRIGRVTAVTVTVLIAFIVISGFGAIIVREISSLGQDLPQYRNNLEAKVQSLPGVIPGGGLFRRTAAILSDLRKELINSKTGALPSSDRVSPTGSSASEQSKPVPVEIQQPALEPLQLAQSIVGPLLQPLAVAGLVVVFVIMILVGWEDLRDRVLRLAGRRDLYRTTEAMNDAAQRVSRYLLRQLLVNLTCAVPIGVGLSVIGIPNALLWAIFVVVLRFVPYLGIIIAAAFPIALAIAVDPGWTLCLWTISLFRGGGACGRQPGRTLGLWRRRRPVAGCFDCGSGLLDLAVGASRVIVVDPDHSVSCCPRPPRPAPPIPRRIAWRWSGADPERDLLPTTARE